jgi:sugar phosphate isomerase/epimerase
MIGLSTSLLCKLPGDQIVGKAIDLGFSQIELNFTLRPDQVRDIVNSCRNHNIRISSLHNFVPEPPEGERGFMLSDLDHSHRQQAVNLTGDTIRRAADLGARAVILHMGQTRDDRMEKIQNNLREAIHEKKPADEVERLRSELIEARKKLPAAHLDMILFSLDKIVPLAENLGVRLGVENRYYLSQFPNFEELGIIMQEFSGSNLGYWHDCGHAAHIAYCGLGTETEALNSYKGRLVGVHLHDIKLWHDHQAPGPDGDIDFGYLKPYIDSGPILALELSSNRDLGLVRPAIEYLNAAGVG